jgi:HAMP domain-containing protein
MTLKRKFYAIIAVAALGFLTLSGVWLVRERSHVLKAREDELQKLVDGPYSILTDYHRMEKAGRLSRAEAQQRAMAIIRVMRYDRDNYFWINDLHPTMVMHPIQPQLEGQDLTGFRDPSGKALFQEMVATVGDHNAGFVSYMWPKPGQDPGKPVPKLSFVREFQPWGWVVGSGIYIDDLEAAWRQNALTAAGLTLACLLVLTLVSTVVVRSILGPLQDMLDRMNEVMAGDMARMSPASKDEMTDLDNRFNFFVNRIQQILSQVSKRPDLPFERVKLAHLRWCERLRRYIAGQGEIDGSRLASHKDCELGRWIYTDALSRYGHVQDMLELESQHKNMHGMVREVVDLKEAGKLHEAIERLPQVEAVSKQVVALLTRLENELKSPGRAYLPH